MKNDLGKVDKSRESIVNFSDVNLLCVVSVCDNSCVDDC